MCVADWVPKSFPGMDGDEEREIALCSYGGEGNVSGPSVTFCKSASRLL